MIKKNYFLLTSIFILISCSSHYQFEYKKKPLTIKPVKVYPPVKFISMSDLHFYDRSLGTSGQSYNDYLDNDRKLLTESENILDAAIDDILKKPGIDFIIISGDLTKDGERINHEHVAKKLQQFTSRGIKVYLINGNHDINNSEAFQYSENGRKRVDTITPDNFMTIYKDFGYSDIIDKDPYSLSYLAEPVKGLWLLMMDSCRYKENKKDKSSITGGHFKVKTLQWIEKILKKSVAENIPVIGVIHHGILEHYKGNKKYYSEYIINDNNRIAEMFAYYGLSIVLTGHFHAQDITYRQYNDNRFIYDIETGSLVTYPCPYRILSIRNDQLLSVQSFSVIPNNFQKSQFKQYAETYLLNGTTKIAIKALQTYGINQNDAEILGQQIAQAYKTHIAGDEMMPNPIINSKGINLYAKIIMMTRKGLIEGWYQDLPPVDNFITINLQDGTYKKTLE